MKNLISVIAAALTLAAVSTPALSQSITRATTQFDADKCKHARGVALEDYGSWRCAGYQGIDIRLSAGDQRMNVSFGKNAAREPAASQTFPGFNSAYKSTVEWRSETLSGGKARPFAAIVRWNVKLEDDERDTTGRVLVVTRLGPGGVCHVGYVDARANPNANDLAAKIADDTARTFTCGKDKPVIAGNVTKGLNFPEKN